MSISNEQLWLRFQKYYTEYPSLGLSLDLSRVSFPDDYFETMKPRMETAFAAMAGLERGAVANPDENRMVGHYWLRNPELAPTTEIGDQIKRTVGEIQSFAADVHRGVVKGAGGAFTHLLLIGIGGSALGSQFISRALGKPGRDNMDVSFFDNTDPDGMDKVLAELGPELGRTLCLVISKSGGTKETRNGMLEAKEAYERAGLSFGAHALAITGVGSELDNYARENGWTRRFPMWDWIGGRTSVMSAVGLVQAALQGVAIDQLLAGAKECDKITRLNNVTGNPASLLAMAWFYSCNGKGEKDMVILPYKDRLELFSRYLQQLVMESLGKELDLTGKVVHQGIAVYGNKGSTDQHAYVQQLRDGISNFFVTFIQVQRDRDGQSYYVEPDITSGDYLFGFLMGTRQALYEKGRESITVTLNEISPFSVGVLIALYERAVGYYASLVNINAYHQPGVEAGKKAAGGVIELHLKVLKYLSDNIGQPKTLSHISQEVGSEHNTELVFKICEHLSANPDRGVVASHDSNPFLRTYQKTG